MTLKLISITFLFTIYFVFSDDEYKGTSFPKKFLVPEDIVPTADDVSYYLDGLNKIVGAMGKKLNRTDPSGALGLFFTTVILKRTLKENREKIGDDNYRTIKEILKQADVIMSHFHYPLKEFDWSHPLKRVAELFLDDSLQVQSIAEYNTNRLTKYILSKSDVNDFGQMMDEITLSKEIYAELVEDIRSEEYTISLEDSDYCLAEIIYNPMPKDEKYRPCNSEKCASVVYRPPSVAYGLSHRLLNVMMARHLRRCYMRSEEMDNQLMDELCAVMYRETVYIMRRGYFYRYMFMEHIALCSFLGYKEFHRRYWFRKVVSWIDDNGCIQENMNFEHNRTRILLEKAEDDTRSKEIVDDAKYLKTRRCFYHQMALGVIVLAHGVRYSINFGGSVNSDSNIERNVDD